MVSMIDNLQPGFFSIGVGLCPSLMGTFDYPPPSNDVKYISVVCDQPKDKIFQVSSFCMTYFNDPWNLLSPSATKFAYSIVQQFSVNPDLTHAHELDLVLKPIWAQGSLATTDYL
jgi:hypothetical protein